MSSQYIKLNSARHRHDAREKNQCHELQREGKSAGGLGMKFGIITCTEESNQGE